VLVLTLENVHQLRPFRGRSMENLIDRLFAGEADKEVRWVVEHNHDFILTNLKEAEQVLLILG
jgi:hypothetical protein